MKSLWDMTTQDFMTRKQAAEVIADAMTRFAAYVANEQGACDDATMRSMLNYASKLHEEAVS